MLFLAYTILWLDPHHQRRERKKQTKLDYSNKLDKMWQEGRYNDGSLRLTNRVIGALDINLHVYLENHFL